MRTKKLANCQIKATFKVSHQEFLDALDQAFPIQNEKVTIKGFRKGKAPKAVYLQHYGKESLYEEAINALVRKHMDEDLAKKKIAVISQPVLDLKWEDLENEEGFEFSLTFDTAPEFDLPEYRGIEVKKLSNEVTKEEIEAEKSRLLKKEIILEEKDGTLEMGDTAKFDFLGTKDGVAFAGGEAKDYELKIGSGQFIPGFEEQMVGMKKGEERDLKVTFPENYFEESLKGQEVNFHVTLHEIKHELLPELTEELFKKLNLDVKDADEFEVYVDATLKARKEDENERKMNNEVLTKLVEATPITLPKSLVENRVESMVRQLEAQAKQYQLPVETLLSFQGTNLEDYKKEAAKYAEREVKFEEILFKIAETEKLVPTEEELTKYTEEYCLANKLDVKQTVKAYGYQPFFNNLVLEKAQKFVLDNKVVTE